jgi:hypothetical protein
MNSSDGFLVGPKIRQKLFWIKPRWHNEIECAPEMGQRQLLEKRSRLRSTSFFALLRRDESARQEPEIEYSRNLRLGTSTPHL